MLVKNLSCVLYITSEYSASCISVAGLMQLIIGMLFSIHIFIGRTISPERNDEPSEYTRKLAICTFSLTGRVPTKIPLAIPTSEPAAQVRAT